jgi:hypothetical protein
VVVVIAAGSTARDVPRYQLVCEIERQLKRKFDDSQMRAASSLREKGL